MVKYHQLILKNMIIHHLSFQVLEIIIVINIIHLLNIFQILIHNLMVNLLLIHFVDLKHQV